MIDPTQIRQKLNRRYAAFLKAWLREEQFFPLSLPVGTLPKDYLALRDGVHQLQNQAHETIGYGYGIEWETRYLRKYGEQSLPQRIVIEGEKDYLKLISKVKEFAQFKTSVALIRAEVPALETWLQLKPLQVIEYGDRWPDLLKVCQYFQTHPTPHCYIRELPIAVHTKFIEHNKGILRSLLEAILPPEQLFVNSESGETSFEHCFGLKYSEPLIRFRCLDPAIQQQKNLPVTDLTTPISEFAGLNFQGCGWIITENLMNFLTVPPFSNTFALFGKGYAVQALKSVDWLHHCPIWYWGDLDVDGFKILSQLRAYFPQTQSVMMDSTTLEVFSEFIVADQKVMATLDNLTAAEAAVYQHLCQHQQRLEQEHISQVYADKQLQQVLRGAA